MKIGIISEGKVPVDSRVPLTPQQCAFLRTNHKLNLVVQSSTVRCFSDQEYINKEVPVVENVDDCDVLLGVKEVPIEDLIPNKTYFFFSHTIKKQDYNKALLKAILEKNIRLIDYEVLVDDSGKRVIAFGIYAGMVGAHNALWTWGHRTDSFRLSRMKNLNDYKAAREEYALIEWPPIKIVLTGTGRVGQGSALVLRDMGIEQVDPTSFLSREYNRAVFTQIDAQHYAEAKDGRTFTREDFYANPQDYHSVFAPYYKSADVMINGIYWDNNAPAFFTADDMCHPDFRIRVIADVTCDIAPVSSIPSTLKASTIADPVFGYEPSSKREAAPFQNEFIDMMTIDNLPNEMPRDASQGFGEQFIENVLLHLLKADFSNPLLQRGTVAANGEVGPHFEYLRDWVLTTPE